MIVAKTKVLLMMIKADQVSLLHKMTAKDTSMKKFLLTAFLGAFISCNAQALEVTVDNQTKATVVMAFSYLDKTSKEWVVDGWYNVKPQKKGIINLSTDNDIYYLYSEFSNGKKLEGGNGSIKLKVQERSFFYKQNDAPSSLNREVSFLRARGNLGKAVIKIK